MSTQCDPQEMLAKARDAIVQQIQDTINQQIQDGVNNAITSNATAQAMQEQIEQMGDEIGRAQSEADRQRLIENQSNALKDLVDLINRVIIPQVVRNVATNAPISNAAAAEASAVSAAARAVAESATAVKIPLPNLQIPIKIPINLQMPAEAIQVKINQGLGNQAVQVIREGCAI